MQTIVILLLLVFLGGAIPAGSVHQFAEAVLGSAAVLLGLLLLLVLSGLAAVRAAGARMHVPGRTSPPSPVGQVMRSRARLRAAAGGTSTPAPRLQPYS